MTLARAMVDHVLGPPEEAPPEALARMARRGTPELRMRAARAMGVRGEEEAAPLLVEMVGDPAPGVRRSAAWSLGLLAIEAAAERLLEAARGERCDAPRLAMAVAAARCGAPVGDAWETVERAARRSMATWQGPKQVAAAIGAGPSERAREWVQAIRPGAGSDAPGAVVVEPARAVRARLRDALDHNPDDRETTEDLAAQQHPDDFVGVVARRRTAGRRESHVLCTALGMLGDPRGLPHLVEVLHAVDTDPGHGFRSRRLTAEALGRIGDPAAGKALVRALEDEALDHEGRPGAGLGIQFPVRVAILEALGECGARESAAEIAGYLGNTEGSALGGFYLPAMDALWKLGDPTPVEAMVDRGGASEIELSNALGVLGAMGRTERVRPFLADPRPCVAAAARDALESVGG